MGSQSELSPNAETFVDKVGAAARTSGQESPGLYQWLFVAASEYGGLLAKLRAASPARDWKAVAQQSIERGEFGPSMLVDSVLAQAQSRAQEREDGQVLVKDILAVIIESLPAELTASAVDDVTGTPSTSETDKAAAADATSAGKKPEVPLRPTPTINDFGRDLTAEAREGKLRPIVGRTEELKTIIEVLCRTLKRNPLLLGPPGSGKTALVEELARRIAAGEVPDLLKDVRLVSIDMSSLTGGGHNDSVEGRVKQILKEAAQPKIILFVDEAHTMMNTGGRTGLADILKPPLARGDVALIAATTDDEYRRFIKPDGALSRRFQPVLVAEMSMDETFAILCNHRDYLRGYRGVFVADHLLQRLLFFAEETMRNRTFPDKGIDLLEQSVASAVAAGKAEVDEADIHSVLARMAGISLGPEEAVSRLVGELERAGLAGSFPTDKLVARLNVTLRQLDVRSWRPNLVVSLGGRAAERAEAIASLFARALYGSEERVLELDLSLVKDEHAISIIIGSSPGLVGYDRQLAIHSLAITPGTVVKVTGMDMCHWTAKNVIGRALADGFFTDSSGARYYLSDAVVVLVGATERLRRPLGFSLASDASKGAAAINRREPDAVLGPLVSQQVDVEIADLDLSNEDETGSRSVSDAIESAVERYRRRGIKVELDDGASAYLVSACSNASSAFALERLAEEWLSDAVLSCISRPEGGGDARIVVSCVDGRARATAVAHERDVSPGEAADA